MIHDTSNGKEMAKRYPIIYGVNFDGQNFLGKDLCGILVGLWYPRKYFNMNIFQHKDLLPCTVDITHEY